MSKSKQPRDVARAMVNPFFAMSNAMLKGGSMVLDSMHAAAKRAKAVQVAVLPELEPTPQKPVARKSSPARAGKKRRARRRR